ncbi:MAG: peptidoglycan DD-metalloendopeptidase family protein [Pseudomonadota bacterium]|nr:peptidoglycan DD-metalloendopeptidase family protein [Pseudomonadota bacterium]
MAIIDKFTRATLTKSLRPRVGLALAFTALILGAAPNSGESKPSQTDLDQTVAELNQLHEWLGDAAVRLDIVQTKLREADTSISEIITAIKQASTNLTNTETAIEVLQHRQTRLTDRRQLQAEKIAVHLRQAHKLSGQDFVKLLLLQETPDTFDRMIRYHGYFSRARKEALQEYRTTLASMERTSTDLEGRRAEFEQREENLSKRFGMLQGERLGRKKLIANLSQEIKDKGLVRDKLEHDRVRIEALLAKLLKRDSNLDGKLFANTKGRLNWPVQGRLTYRFGEPRAGGRLSWEGIYFSAPSGSVVTAVGRGRIVFSDWLRGFGLLTIIDHGNEQMSLYGFCDSLVKQNGDWVESGEIVASAGQSGGQDLDGLYFEIRINGQPTNSLAWLAKR